jgi:hypothetical protein
MSRAYLLISVLAVACGSEVAPSVTSDAAGSRSCSEGGKTYAHGASWKCSDGCNSCGCSDGMISSTTMACIDGGPRSCTEGGSTYAHGASWPCSDGCNSCSCIDGLVSSTTKACPDAGAAARRCYPYPEGTHTSSSACPPPESFGSIYLTTFPCTERCLRCPTSLSVVKDAYCDGSKWVAPSDICSAGPDAGESGVEWYHGPPPTCADGG